MALSASTAGCGAERDLSPRSSMDSDRSRAAVAAVFTRVSNKAIWSMAGRYHRSVRAVRGGASVLAG